MTRDGDAIAQTGDGRRVIVERAIVGERVEVRIAARPDRDGTWPSELLRVVEPSPHRVTPRCRHFGPCGGCTWQHIAYAEQLRLKRRLCQSLVREALGADAPPVDDTVRSGRAGETPWGYRSKVHFVFADRGGALAMGHFKRHSTDVLPVEECPVHADDGNRLAFALRDQLVRAGVPAASADLRRGTARHVVARVARHTSERALTLVVRTLDQRAAKAAPLAPDAAAVPDASVHLNLHEADDPYLFGPTTRTLKGRDRVREVVGGASYLIAPTAFFQTNVDAAEALVDLVLGAVPADARTVLDLYAGVGLFALPLARRGHRVVAIEESEEAVAGGIASRRLNGMDDARCRFVADRVEDALKSPRLRLEPDVVVLDPPRAGCEPRVLRHVLGRLHPPRVVYVSCNPAALARDLVVARDLGYAASRLTPVDMFPHTPHVETVAVLTPAGRR